MARFCPNCGCAMDDNTLFCASCGTKVEIQQPAQPEQPTYNQYDNFGYQAPQQPAAPQQPSPAPAAKKSFDIKKIDKKFFIIGGAAILAIIMIILAISIVFSPKAIAKRYVNGMIKANGRKIVNCVPSFMWEDKDEKKEAIDDLSDLYEEMFEDYKKVKIEKVVVNKLSEDEQDELEEELEAMEKYYDFNANKINPKSARKVAVMVSYKDEDNEYSYRVMQLLLIKYKGQWKVLSGL